MTNKAPYDNSVCIRGSSIVRPFLPTCFTHMHRADRRARGLVGWAVPRERERDSFNLGASAHLRHLEIASGEREGRKIMDAPHAGCFPNPLFFK